MKVALKFVSVATAVFMFFVFGFAWRDLQTGSLPSAGTVRSFLNIDQSAKSQLSPTRVFKHAYNQILADYYRPVEAQSLKYAGMSGLMAALGDPHTVFMEPRDAQEFALETKANFVGVGARLSPNPLGAKVEEVFEDGPAHKAGLLVGDIITGVDGEEMVGKNIDDVVKRIRGEEGTHVRIKLIRGEAAAEHNLTAKRAQITTPTVRSKMLDDETGYLAIASFSEPTSQQFDKHLSDLERQGMKSLVLDVRNNPGGLLETSVELLSRFVEDKVVVKMRFRDGNERAVRTYIGLRRKFNYPIVVLINEDSASAAEIFAGVLRDYKIATLVGEHTYGKASVQDVYGLGDKASAKITIARYFLPNGEDISRKVDPDGQYLSGGLQPDVKAELDYDKEPKIGEPDTDGQLAKAMEILSSKR
jgi:carboxyl-terminal processing protease